MKVYVKSEDKQSIWPGLIITIVFLVFSLSIFGAFIFGEGTFMDKLSGIGVGLLFALVFFYFGLTFLIFLFKRPSKYVVKVINKYNAKVDGEDVVFYVVEGDKEREQSADMVPESFKCYTYEDRYNIGDTIIAGVKEFNWEIKYIEDYNSDSNEFIPNTNNNIVLNAILFILGGIILFTIIGAVFYTEYIVVYLIVGLMTLIGLIKAIQLKDMFK